MMANVSDSGELRNELWKLSDIDELFARVPLPYDVLIDVPELDDALAATHSAVESTKVCYAGPRLKDSAPTGIVRKVLLDVLRDGVADHCCAETFCTRQCKKEHRLSRSVWRDWSESVPDGNVLSSRRASPTFFTCQAKEAGFVGSCSKFAVKMGIRTLHPLC